VKIRNLCIAGVVLTTIVLIGMFPIFLSSSWFQNICIRQINRHISGTLSLGACTIGWRQGLQCGRIFYEDADHGIHATLPSLTSNRSLLALLAAPTNFGTISVENPVFTFSGSPVATGEPVEPPPEKNVPPVTGHSPQPDQKISKKNSVSFWEKITARLHVNKAVVNIVLDRHPAEVFIQKGGFQANLLDGSIQFELDLTSNSGGGKINTAGFINFPAQQGAVLDSLITEINVHIADFQVDPFISLLSNHDALPFGWGELSSELLIKATGTSNVQVSGTSMLSGLDLSGGFLGQDQARFEQVDLDFTVQNDADRGWKLSKLQFSSDIGMVELSGNFRSSRFMLNGTGTIDLALVLGRFPHLFNVRPDISLESGVMDFTFDLDRDGRQFTGVADAAVDGLGGMQRGKPFVWKNPMHLNIDAALNDGEPEIRKVVLAAPFFDLRGKGDFKDFTLEGTADFSRAVEEIGRIFRLDGWAATGKLQFNAESKEDGADKYFVNTRMEISDFSLSQWGKPVVPSHTLIARGHLKTPGRIPENRADAMDLFFALSSWPGSMHGHFDSIYRKDGDISARYQLQSELHFGRLTDLLHTLELLNRETTVTGNMSSRASGYIEGSRLVVREFDGWIRDLRAHDHGKIFVDPSLHVYTTKPVVETSVEKMLRPMEMADNSTTYFARGAGCSLVDRSLHLLELRNLALTSTITDVNVQRLTVEDWNHLSETLSLQANGTADFSRLTPLFKQYGILKPDQTLTGNGFFTVDLGAGKMDKRRLTARLQGDSLEFSGVELQNYVFPVSMENGRLQAEFKGGVNKGTFLLSPHIDYTVDPPLATLPEAEQILSDVQLDQPVIDAVLKRIQPLLALLVHPSGILSARVDRFSWPLVTGGEQRADFSVVLKVSRITLAAQGILKQILDMAGLAEQPLSLQQSEITCNGGREG